MNARELYSMLGDIARQQNLPDLSRYKIVTEDGTSVSGIWTDHDAQKIIVVRYKTREMHRVDV
jgi:hypothetical protein